MVDYEIKYSYKDISIVPVRYSRVAHRSECNPEGVLPIFTAPMTSVVGINSVPAYKSCGITPILPRPTDLKTRLDNLGWSAYGLEEFKTYFCKDALNGINKKVLIDIANGHMTLLFDLVQEAKKKHPDLTIMIGNIANPETIVEADSAGADYVRLGIGAGDGCITTSNTGIHYPMASLISEASGAKNLYRLKIKLVADGGIRGYADVIKALALGADYVMIGREFSKLIEAEGAIFQKDKDQNGEVVFNQVDKSLLGQISGYQARVNGYCRPYYGNSTPEMRAKRAGYSNVDAWKKSHPRVKVKDAAWDWVSIDSTLSEWVAEFKHCVYYSFMMTGSLTWQDFKTNAKYGIQQ